jgi:CRISPR/Cas system endoribonuclease Cas6 (RAMP superfamily)
VDLDDFDFGVFYEFLKNNVGKDFDDYYKTQNNENYIFRKTLIEFDNRFKNYDLLRKALKYLDHVELISSGGILGDFGGREIYDNFRVDIKYIL